MVSSNLPPVTVGFGYFGNMVLHVSPELTGLVADKCPGILEYWNNGY